jgi:hypothetical protein
MSRGGWKSVAMVVRYEHASEERDALIAQELNSYTKGLERGPNRDFATRRSRT